RIGIENTINLKLCTETNLLKSSLSSLQCVPLITMPLFHKIYST
ncbi:unnamed protein product, partial [Leptidea sinapis]